MNRSRAMAIEDLDGPPIERFLTYSWLLVLLAAPIIIALLIWFRVLLNRRNELTANRSNQLKQERLVTSYCNANPILMSSQRRTSQQAQHQDQDRSPRLGSKECKIPALCSLVLQDKLLNSLVTHTSLYLASMASQQIFACFLAVSMAILNLLKARNLLACNLIIFLLMSGKLLALFSLTTFSLFRSLKVLNLRRGVMTKGCPCTSSSSSKSVKSSSPSSSSVSQTSASVPGEPSNFFGSATTCRLLADASRDGRRKSATRPRSTADWQVWQALLLILLSASLATVYLYLRLMNMMAGSRGSQATTGHAFGAHPATNKTITARTTPGDTWPVSPMYSTEYYSSTQMTPSSASYLHQLVDQYELDSFIRLLFSASLVTERFCCTLAAANYVPAAKISAMLLYASLMLVILLASVLAQLWGREALRCLIPPRVGSTINLRSLVGSETALNQLRLSESRKRRHLMANQHLGRTSDWRVQSSSYNSTGTCSTTCSWCSSERTPNQRGGGLTQLPVGGAATVASLSSLVLASSSQRAEGAESAAEQDLASDRAGSSLKIDCSRMLTGAIWHNQTSSASSDWLMYAELKRDLKLGQSLILFGQLLDHAPVLVSSLKVASLSQNFLNASAESKLITIAMLEAGERSNCDLSVTEVSLKCAARVALSFTFARRIEPVFVASLVKAEMRS